MEVCNICGAFLIVGDAQQRLQVEQILHTNSPRSGHKTNFTLNQAIQMQDHLEGKQHIGYARLREAVDKINQVSSKICC